MTKLSETERLLIQRGIAAAIDNPSVYMGGPSKGAMRKAISIVEHLEAAGRLVPATCSHSAWRSYEEHGTCCPTCGLSVDSVRREP